MQLIDDSVSCNNDSNNNNDNNNTIIVDNCKAPTIAGFLAEKNIFVTGGTGFLGTVLIESLLSSTTKIGTIYVLVRAKYGADANERIQRLLSKQVNLWVFFVNKWPDLNILIHIFRFLTNIQGKLLKKLYQSLVSWMPRILVSMKTQ